MQRDVLELLVVLARVRGRRRPQIVGGGVELDTGGGTATRAGGAAHRGLPALAGRKGEARLGYIGGAQHGASRPDAEAWRRQTPLESRRRPVCSASCAHMGSARAGGLRWVGGLDRAAVWAKLGCGL
jgi:hypothetical protein